MIWWLASYPKSGNTWLRMFLAAYRNGWLDINLPRGLLLDDVGETFYQMASGSTPITELNDLERFLIRPAALMNMARVTKCDPMFVKTHFSNVSMGGVPGIPAPLTHGAVYIVRDPRDVAVSYARHRDVPIDEAIESMAKPTTMLRYDNLYQYMGNWSEHVTSWTDKTRFPTLAVKFEDMKRAPRQAFSGILGFLKHEYDEERFTAALEMTSLEALREQEDAREFREKARGERFFNDGGDWRNVLTEAQAERIHADHHAAMEEFGYGRLDA